MASSYMKDPVTVFVGSLDLAAVHSVIQRVLFVEGEDADQQKRAILTEFVENMKPGEKAIVFVGKKARVDDIVSNFVLISCNEQWLNLKLMYYKISHISPLNLILLLKMPTYFTQ